MPRLAGDAGCSHRLFMLITAVLFHQGRASYWTYTNQHLTNCIQLTLNAR